MLASRLIGPSARPAEASFGLESRPDLLSYAPAFLRASWVYAAGPGPPHYANLNTRTPLVAAALQVTTFVALSLLLTQLIGLPGIPAAAAVTFTAQAIGLLMLLNRRFSGVLKVGDTALRAVGGTLAAAFIAAAIIRYLPLSDALGAITAVLGGALVAAPFIWREIRLLMNL
jgi:peptidoglycan biosynthesis protein MviN/MurJ (putative lipid II flippase)